MPVCLPKNLPEESRNNKIRIGNQGRAAALQHSPWCVCQTQQEVLTASSGAASTVKHLLPSEHLGPVGERIFFRKIYLRMGPGKLSQAKTLQT